MRYFAKDRQSQSYPVTFIKLDLELITAQDVDIKRGEGEGNNCSMAKLKGCCSKLFYFTLRFEEISNDINGQVCIHYL